MMWADLKRHVRKHTCTSIIEVMEAVKEFQKGLTPEKCQNYINRLHSVIDTVIRKKGAWSCGV